MADGSRFPAWPAAMRAERAAAYLDVSGTYFRQHIAPDLNPIRRGKGIILYPRRQLDAWLDRQEGAAAPSATTTPDDPDADNPWLAP
jgi:hypothetical protein